MVRWAFQCGFLCVPRSGAGSKLERQAILENSFSGISSFTLTEDEISIINGLDEQFPAGRLNRCDGWTQDDIPTDQNEQVKWDPTLLTI